jgi:hypothetical protein
MRKQQRCQTCGMPKSAHGPQLQCPCIVRITVESLYVFRIGRGEDLTKREMRRYAIERRVER